MDIKIIKLVTTRYDYDVIPVVEEKIIGVVNVDEDITELVDLYHDTWRRFWDSEDTPGHFENACEEKIETEVVKLSTVQELVSEYNHRVNTRQNGELKSGSQALEELKTKLK